jgi:hypothetical protein
MSSVIYHQLRKWPVSWALPTAPSINGARELGEHGLEAFPGSGHQTAQEEEIRHLKRELEITKQERDTLKKSHRAFLPNDELLQRTWKEPVEPCRCREGK